MCTSVQVATHTCRQQNSNFHPILGESSLKLILWLYFFSQPLMLTVDKGLSSGKFKLNVFKSAYLSTEFIVYLFRFWKCFINIYFFITFLILDIRDLKSRLGQTAKALGLVSAFNTFYYIHAKVRLRAVSYFSFKSPWTDSTEHTWGARNVGDLTFLFTVRGSEERRTTARGLQKSAFQGSTSWIAVTFCPNFSNCQSACEVCCSGVNVIPNLSIVPKKLVMVTLKLSELHSENRPILPCK